MAKNTSDVWNLALKRPKPELPSFSVLGYFCAFEQCSLDDKKFSHRLWPRSVIQIGVIFKVTNPFVSGVVLQLANFITINLHETWVFSTVRSVRWRTNNDVANSHTGNWMQGNSKFRKNRLAYPEISTIQNYVRYCSPKYVCFRGLEFHCNLCTWTLSSRKCRNIDG